MPLRAGFAQLDITPPLGLPLGGYGARLASADAILDPLFCRAAVFDDGTTLVGIVVLDLVYLSADWTAGIRRRATEALGLGGACLLVSATHTHAGPGVFRSSIVSDARFHEYEDALAERVTACLSTAHRAAVPARVCFGAAQVHGIAANRRDPGLAVDETVRVLCAHSGSGRLLGVVANFACHPTVLSAANCSYSADLFGAAAEGATRELGAVVVLTNGAAGDVSTRFTRRAQTIAEVHRMGTTLARAVCAAARSTTPIAGRLGAALDTVPVRWRDLPTPESAIERLKAASQTLHRLRAEEADTPSVRLAESRVEGAQAELWVSSQGGWQAVFGAREPLASVQALRCGEVAIVGAPGELFSPAGVWLRERLGERTLVVGYANDYLGYFVPEQDAHAGGYESLIAMLDPPCEGAIREGLLDVARRALEERSA